MGCVLAIAQLTRTDELRLASEMVRPVTSVVEMEQICTLAIDTAECENLPCPFFTDW